MATNKYLNIDLCILLMETIIISLGGSLIIPEEIDTEFLKHFKSLVLKHINKGKRFILICGGGKTARKYQKAAESLKKASGFEKDIIGIAATKLNAMLVKTIFEDKAVDNLVDDPTQKIKFNKPILVASGWKPGCSTDYDAVLIAENFKVKRVINLSNISYVYGKDPKFKDAKPMKKMSWDELKKIVGTRWDPGLHAPFDPIATKKAKELGLKVVIMNGTDLKNLDNFLNGKDFKGTVIG